MGILKHIEDRSLAHITRFSASPQHFEESVADHSFFVAYITSLICLLLREKNIAVDYEKAITMALIHDMEERFSGDILSPFKHHSKEVNEAIRKVNQGLIAEVFNELPENIKNHYISLWNEEGEQKSTEAQVVKTADRMSLLAKCREEIAAGNEFFKEIYDKEYKKVAENQADWWQKIKSGVI
ncbi:hypothetical protein A3B19_00410 [Candidatus Giovannonibacteria bacterium RIFCSPLOWO2_01_FULL_46_32]|uniref:HD/PDEase domain-containing protein n=1 Tax=Candidatus Giovannonibacteria bacterium RIFCSPLOWO2_01_FULL_46_32 TaxID=1798353 RepID=A0A1F5XFH3_9BACT|nr:MAG: hypothetical protein A3B19_00410 [Candidatus Giovannonibacteria bacterium RIFCSPLOWO2_01_FULL_46_32]